MAIGCVGDGLINNHAVEVFENLNPPSAAVCGYFPDMQLRDSPCIFWIVMPHIGDPFAIRRK